MLTALGETRLHALKGTAAKVVRSISLNFFLSAMSEECDPFVTSVREVIA